MKNRVIIGIVGLYISLIFIISFVLNEKLTSDIINKYQKILNAASNVTLKIIGRNLDFTISNPPDKDTFDKITSTLNNINNGMKTQYIYLIARDDKGFYFISSSETDNDIKNGDISYFGERYVDAPADLIEAFDRLEIIYSEPYQDKWGNFISIFHPVITSKKDIFVIGADIAIENLNKSKSKAIFFTIMIAFILLLPIGAIFFISYLNNKKRETELLSTLYQNNITHLPNKNSLLQELCGNKGDYSLLILKINNFNHISTFFDFKKVNDLIIQIVKYLTLNKTSNAQIFHIETDEFAILIKNSLESEELNLACQILSFFRETPIEISDITLPITFTIGIAQKERDDLFQKAKAALYNAFSRCNNCYAFYEEKRIENGTNILQWINIIKSSIENDDIFPYYQPIYNIKTQKVEKYECLIRLKNNGTVLSPFAFLESAKMGGFLNSMTKIMINKTFGFFADKDVEFSINVTGEDLKDEFFYKFVEMKLQRFNINPSKVVFEILEDMVISDDSLILKSIKKLEGLGCKIAIDDFGTLNSNFSNLLKIKVDFIKIDGQFIKHIDSDTELKLIVGSIVHFAKNAGIKTVAEYVHNNRILEIVSELGVDFAQGYFIGEPKDNLKE